MWSSPPHLLLSCPNYALSGPNSGISCVVYLAYGKLEYHCTIKSRECSPPQSAYGNSAKLLNVDVLKFCKWFSWTPFTWLETWDKALNPTSIANPVPSLTLTTLYPLPNIFMWTEKMMIIMVAHGNSLPISKPCRHKSGPKCGRVLFQCEILNTYYFHLRALLQIPGQQEIPYYRERQTTGRQKKEL